MRALARRRAISLATLSGLSVLAIVAARVSSLRLIDTSLLTGWLLLALTFGLALFGARKKLPFLPLGRASTWLQLHVYAGLFTALVFLLHIRWRVPNGTLEATLAVAFAVVVVSGVVGLLISRRYARRLTSRGQEVIFERIPALRRRLRDQAEELALAASGEGATAISDFYGRRLSDFFSGPRNVVLHLVESKRPRLQLTQDLAAFERYLNESDRRRTRELGELVLMKDDLDYHYALQGALKVWLFVHIPVTAVMLILAVFHGLMAQAFSTGLR